MTGTVDWDDDSVLLLFKKEEDWEDDANDSRGAGDPMRVERAEEFPQPLVHK